VSGETGVLVMAYGTASGPEDVERYYTDIRGGRVPSPEHLRELLGRYEAIGNVFPLLATTEAQAAGLERELNAGGDLRARAYLGMKHSPPFVPEAIAAMRRDRIERAVGIVMAPHWSAMSIETYVERVERELSEHGGPSFTFVRSFHDHPAFVDLLASRVAAALERVPSPDRDRAMVVFSAHSLPTRMLEDGSQRCKTCTVCEASCRYRDELLATAGLVAERLGLANAMIAWQSAGRTADPWWGPAIEDVIPELAARGFPAVVVCSAGFVADHLETLYDLDVEAAGIARDAGIRFERTEMPNASAPFVRALARVVRDHLRERQEASRP
jgi:ferrochelatase